jgi:hypothetical protein
MKICNENDLIQMPYLISGEMEIGHSNNKIERQKGVKQEGI